MSKRNEKEHPSEGCNKRLCTNVGDVDTNASIKTATRLEMSEGKGRVHAETPNNKFHPSQTSLYFGVIPTVPGSNQICL